MRRRRLVSLLIGLWFVPLVGLAGSGATETALAARLSTLAGERVGQLGVAAQLLGDSKVIAVNGDQPFPLASTYKVAIAVAVLRLVDAGDLALTDMITLRDDDWVFSPVIATNFIHAGVALSVANLVEVMITHSDNTATDACLRLVGGPAAVTRTLRQLGISDMRVDRDTGEILEDFYGVSAGGREGIAAVTRFAADQGEALLMPSAEFEADPLDKTTPQAMLALLVAIADGQAMSEASTAFLLGAMSRTVTRPQRLGGALPANTPIAHKTGSIGGVANDVGYITLPDGRRFALAVFTRSSETSLEARESAIADVTRALYDHYLVHGR